MTAVGWMRLVAGLVCAPLAACAQRQLSAERGELGPCERRTLDLEEWDLEFDRLGVPGPRARSLARTLDGSVRYEVAEGAEYAPGYPWPPSPARLEITVDQIDLVGEPRSENACARKMELFGELRLDSADDRVHLREPLWGSISSESSKPTFVVRTFMDPEGPEAAALGITSLSEAYYEVQIVREAVVTLTDPTRVTISIGVDRVLEGNKRLYLEEVMVDWAAEPP